jgi:hypothetical protein
MRGVRWLGPLLSVLRRQQARRRPAVEVRLHRLEVVATNRAFRLHIDGGSGSDTIKVNLSNAVRATFAWDVSILAGSGQSSTTFVSVNPGGNPTFGPAGAVFIDGGGQNNPVDVFGNFPVDVLDAQS